MELVMNGPSISPYNDIKEKLLKWFRSVPKFQRNIPTLQNELRTVILPAAIENHTLSLNSIIDLSDNTNDSQKKYFNQNEWDTIKKYYNFETKLTKIKKFDCLDRLNSKLKELELVDAYALAGKLEIKNLGGYNEVLFKTYAHVIIFFYDEKLVDLTNMEAARYMIAKKKTNDDHLKLAIESKDILDYLIKNSNNFDHTRFCVPMIQICNNQCVVLKLYLADNGLYCVDEFVNLTIPLNPAEFAAQSSQWFQKLFSLRSHVFKLLHLLEDTN
ncbi:hypothetical protein HPULCUR_003506 [Helicostylum pulchrum]|uniref:Uncharacterized protein n=1 Tax=Helicostylum pulchrum TaxID=562976 RepID=A0ABP9XTL1_9FUNG